MLVYPWWAYRLLGVHAPGKLVNTSVGLALPSTAGTSALPAIAWIASRQFLGPMSHSSMLLRSPCLLEWTPEAWGWGPLAAVSWPSNQEEQGCPHSPPVRHPLPFPGWVEVESITVVARVSRVGFRSPQIWLGGGVGITCASPPVQDMKESL